MDHLKPAADVASIGVVVATLTQFLPSIAAAVSIVWGLIRIYETKTVQAWIKRRRKNEQRPTGN